jgi:hypothetical protein
MGNTGGTAGKRHGNGMGTAWYVLIGLKSAIHCVISQDGNVKATPLQAWKGPKDSRRLRLPDSKAVGTGWW